jgi:hypothetical protein
MNPVRTNDHDIVQGFNFAALPIKVGFLGKIQDREWPHFLWSVAIPYRDGKGMFFTQYRTGLGLVKKAPKATFLEDRPKVPENADIMYSLTRDAEAANMSFRDWCADFGYSDDSLKALEIYRACCDIGVELMKVFTRDELATMREALQDF